MWLFDVLFFDLAVDRTHEPCVPTLCECLFFIINKLDPTSSFELVALRGMWLW